MKAEAPSAPPNPTSQEAPMSEFTSINDNTGSHPASTPTKRGKKPAAANSENATPTKKPKAAGSSPSKKSLGPIPTSFDTAGVPDKMILRMRDEEGKNWTEINESWMKITGIKVGTSTLRMRYTTMKANFVEISVADEGRFLRLKREVEERFQQEKWHKIAEAIEADGGRKYPVPALQKKFKELAKKDNHVDMGKDEE
ncbi:hypothetical protein BDV28DRAFT_147434 [Aspergillus coremiiformis]|uniref:Uncharacterized protein n=1 Tax=Aspergillus coremiiformis TaxID=138285 RepID=A0A5N6Z8Y2_9EURO|nr:hypothetical protein BDV28DRAFT_147434 [Aspergillus coremiiformis]